MTQYCKLQFPSYAGLEAKTHYRPDMEVYPTHITFDFDFDVEGESIIGNVTHHLKFVADVESITFQAESLDVLAIIDSEGNKIDYDNTGSELILDYGGKTNEEKVLTISYQVTHPKAGFYFVAPDDAYPNISHQVWSQFQDEDAHFVVPVMDNPAFKHTSEVIGRIPLHWTSLSNGKLLSTTEENGKKVMHWKFDVKHSTYLVTFAAGDLFEHKEESNGVEIRWYAPKGKEKEAENAYKNTGDILKFFSDYTHYPYPYKSYSQWSASRFIFGGMENTSATTQTDLTLRDDRATLDSTSDNLVAHEASHQWFGDWITAKSWAHAWLHESFATYFDALYTEHSKGRDEFHYQMKGNKEAYINEDSSVYRRPIVTKIYEEPIDLFDRHLYPGGSWRVHMLRNLLGEEVFRNVLKHYLNEHAQGLVETVDLARAIETITGKNYDWFFDQWIYQSGYPKLKFKYSWDKKYSMAKITVQQTQKIEKHDTISTKVFKIPSKFAFYFDGKEQRFPIKITEREHTFYFNLEKKPDFVRFDPDYAVLASISFKKSQDMLLTQLENDPTPIGKILAITTLAKKASFAGVEAIGNVLKAEEVFWGVRVEAALSLGKIGGKQTEEILIDALEVQHPKVRRAVVNALANFPEREPVQLAIKEKIAAGDESYYVEGALLATYGKLKADNAIDVITGALSKPTFNDFSYIQAIAGIAAQSTEAALDKIIKLAQYGQPELARISAVTQIGKLGKYLPNRHKLCFDELQKFTKDPLFRVRMAAIPAFGDLGLSAAIPLLKQMVEKEADGRVKKVVRFAIDKINKSQSKPEEIQQLQKEIEKIEKVNKDLSNRIRKLEAESKE